MHHVYRPIFFQFIASFSLIENLDVSDCDIVSQENYDYKGIDFGLLTREPVPDVLHLPSLAHLTIFAVDETFMPRLCCPLQSIAIGSNSNDDGESLQIAPFFLSSCMDTVTSCIICHPFNFRLSLLSSKSTTDATSSEVKNIAQSSRLAALTKLALNGSDIADDKSIGELLSACTVLRKLTIVTEWCSDILNVLASSNVLTQLTSLTCHHSDRAAIWEGRDIRKWMSIIERASLLVEIDLNVSARKEARHNNIIMKIQQQMLKSRLPHVNALGNGLAARLAEIRLESG